MEKFLSCVASGIVPLVTNTIIKHVAYPFTVSHNVRALESVTRELAVKKEDVKTKITNAERENGVPTEQVKLWLDEVEAVEQKAAEILQNNQQRCRCLLNISPNLWSNYKISRSAAKKQLEVKILSDKKPIIEEMITHMPPPLAQQMPASLSKSSNLELALHHIKNDENGIIGIWGMGGVGKTHLLKQLNNELCRDGAFEVVVFVACSKECSVEKVQQEIIEKLRLNGSKSEEIRQSNIHNFLKQKSFVLLLDDLWSRVDLETVGIPLNVVADNCKRKVVLTTRSTEVCGQMEVRKKIKMDVLNWNDAWTLFKEKVTEETINSHPLIQRCAVDVAKELSGLPLALITIGRSMHDKTDPSEWEQAFELLKKALLIDVEFSSTNQSVFHTLKFSYDNLKTDTLKQCFLHCSLCPENRHINKTDLVQLWMGLGLLEEPSIHAAYNFGYSCIKRLQAVCLLEEFDGDDRHIKMHDVIRDMALWIAHNEGNEKNKWIVQAGTLKKTIEIEVSCDTEKLSQMYGTTKKVFLSTTSSSTKLSTMLLNNNRLCDLKPLKLEAFSKLLVLDLSWNSIETFPVEICKLVLLQFLNLSHNYLQNSLPEELKALINLKYLLLFGNRECTIPNGVLSELKALRVLELRDIYKVREDNIRIFASLEEELQCLPHFQALGITIRNMDDFQMLSQTGTVPVRDLNISMLETEEECLSFASCFENSQLRNNLVSLELDCIPVKWVKFERTASHVESICYHGRLEKLSFSRMYNMKDVVWMGLDPKNVFSRLQVLDFTECDELKSISWIARLPCIRKLAISLCMSVKQLISIDELKNDGFMVAQPSFSFLKEISLFKNPKLESICDPQITFPALERFDMILCEKLKKLPFKTDNPPKKLRLDGTEKWWNNIVEMDDVSHRSLLEPFYR